MATDLTGVVQGLIQPFPTPSTTILRQETYQWRPCSKSKWSHIPRGQRHQSTSQLTGSPFEPTPLWMFRRDRGSQEGASLKMPIGGGRPAHTGRLGPADESVLSRGDDQMGKEANTVTQFALESQLSGHSGVWQCPALRERLRKWPFSTGMPQVAQEAILGIASREVLMTYKLFSGGSETQIEPWSRQRTPINAERKDC